MIAADDQALAIWKRVTEAGHLDCGAWSTDAREAGILCACGERITEPQANGTAPGGAGMGE